MRIVVHINDQARASLLDRERIAKLLNQTRSDNDHEALLAIRLANRELDKTRAGWDSVFSHGSTSRVDIDAAYARGCADTLRDMQAKRTTYQTTTVGEMLKVVLESIHDGSGRDFIKSLDEQFKRRGSLTQRQREALEKFYNNVQ